MKQTMLEKVEDFRGSGRLKMKWLWKDFRRSGRFFTKGEEEGLEKVVRL